MKNTKRKMDCGISLLSKRKGNCGRKRITTSRTDKKCEIYVWQTEKCPRVC